MPRHRTYANAAARQAAYRKRDAMKRNRNVTIRDNDFLERLTFVRDTAGAISRDSVKNWAGWRGSAELHAFALQEDLDVLVLRLDALLSGDAAPFSGPEWQAWRQERERQPG
jgi:hypothetical protein